MELPHEVSINRPNFYLLIIRARINYSLCLFDIPNDIIMSVRDLLNQISILGKKPQGFVLRARNYSNYKFTKIIIRKDCGGILKALNLLHKSLCT